MKPEVIPMNVPARRVEIFPLLLGQVKLFGRREYWFGGDEKPGGGESQRQQLGAYLISKGWLLGEPTRGRLAR